MTATIGGILLAAGTGTRFEGGNKLLAELDGASIVRQAALTLLGAPLDAVVAVLGHEAASVESMLSDLDLAVRYNDDYAEGQSSSVAVGVGAARGRDWDGAVFALGDMPYVDPETVETLVDAYEAGAGPVLAPAYEGTRGNPALFDSEYFDALGDVTGDRGGRDIIENVGTLISVDDPGVCQDIDRRRDIPE